MVSGELYIADDPHLHALGAKRRRLQHEINTSAWDAFDERTALFRELFGAIGEGSHIEPPFRCDYGCNITIGHGFYANTDCIILDVAPVTIGDGATIAAGSVITRNAPEGKLTLARVRQETIDGWHRPVKK